MDKGILVSIIVPIYNQEEYLNISLPTLKQQTYKNLEFILVDDGSTDSSKQIINEYLNADSRFKYVYKENGGLVSATIAGVKEASGDYLAFLDPDDKLGLDYIENFIKELDCDYDFIAAGFFYDDGKLIKPYYLKENSVLTQSDIKKLRTDFLSDTGELAISNRVFISRWNKLYKTNLVKEIVKEFRKFEMISLGEDTIFTFLLLQKAQLGKTIALSNSYFYNVGNPNSMMKEGAIINYVEKCRIAYQSFTKLLIERNLTNEMSCQLYYFLVLSFFNRLKKEDMESFKKLYDILKRDPLFLEILFSFQKKANKKQKLQLLMIRLCKSGKQYLNIKRVVSKLHAKLKLFRQNFKLVGKQIFRKNLVQLAYFLKFQQQRKNSFDDMKVFLPIIEERLKEDLLEFQKLEVLPSTIEKNIFVFWWDGFDEIPEIVSICLASLKKNYPECKLHLIHKDNYQDYTNIHPNILNDFNKGKISVQTFSDVLRFNLLKNNGGMWVDSTIYFTKKIDLFQELEKCSFSTLNFSTSKDFMSYKGEVCTWSGFMIASHKQGRLVSIINEIFERYYLKYNTFSTYFFIDIVFMLCKVYKLDDNVLDQIILKDGNMFQLASVLDQPFNKSLLPYIEKLPQKLFWNYEDNNLDNFYKYFKEIVS